MRKLIPSLLLILALASPVFLASQDNGDGGPDTHEQRGPDGHYHDPVTGVAQPEHCDNDQDNKTPCECKRADMHCKGPSGGMEPGSMCQTWCRKNDCHCINPCDS